MLVDGWINFDPRHLSDHAHTLELERYDGAWAPEAGHDPLLILTRAASSTTRLELGTGIVVAFGRSPLITATMANDVQILSQGRLLLGLGSQIKPHIEKRYSMPWSRPAARMREYVLALKAIWSSWNEGSPMNFRGEFYRHTLMTPFFSPSPHEYGPPKIFLAAVGELMTEVAGEVADGLLVHPFTTERYLREVTLPALERGFAKGNRDRATFQISFSGMVVPGDTDAERTSASVGVRKQLAFYGSTPAYRGVLDLHGWGELQPRLNELSRSGGWDEMAELIDDDVLDAFSVVAPVNQIASRVQQRFGDTVDRFSVYSSEHIDEERARAILAGFRST
ncbi:MAG TPA: TIGR03617 family F420-dependent LLM class oxidoreductase [Acidimicrobiales bacterium]|jgi:probable F420-dependent oxidoreductase|nr:TIGR03617 family F420-dependent LLM class oxidoreductase [Acidimicrobiales bacterium]